MAATSVTLAFLCVAFAGAHVLRVDAAGKSSAQIDATGKVQLMNLQPEGAGADVKAQGSKEQAEVRGAKAPQLQEAATFAQIKPAKGDDVTLEHVRESLTDAILDFLQGGKVQTRDVSMLFDVMKPHLEGLKSHSEIQPDVKAVDAIDEERLASFIQKQGATAEQMKSFRMLFGLERLLEENDLSLAQGSKLPGGTMVESMIPDFDDVKRAIFGGELYQMINGLALTTAFCPPCGAAIVLVGISNLIILEIRERAGEAE